MRIRLANKSQYLYESIRVNTSTGSVSFGDLSAMQESAYKEFELAYRYAFIELEIGGVIFTIQPIDYGGETPLKNGKYTYEIRANDSQDRYGKLSLSLVRDE
ncbi:hypothetical protein [Altibacter lentus]|uniref:hypothetical protein n=1 Tax=Altibacter lentus TaxID=1223410 RepID=UPI001268FEDE|nr:hypothetical protein [Altibacter lentus]